MVFGQGVSEPHSISICWAEETKLRWSDFQGVPDSTSSGLAGCAATLEAIGFWDKGLPNFKVTNCFNKIHSWAKDTTSIHLLKHEQLHFDIAEIHARKLRKTIDSLRFVNVDDMNVYSDRIEYILDLRDSVNIQYDTETAHSIYRLKQKEWEEKITNLLKELDDYSK
jgi:hypothetical protein